MLTQSTVGFSLSKIIRCLSVNFSEQPITQSFTYKHAIGLKTCKGSELIDYWLTQYERPMPPLCESDDLEVIYSHGEGKAEVNLEDFEVVKVIGRGGFSKVLEVRKKSNAAIYAMKVIKKSFVISNNKVKEIMAERHILATTNHPFIVRLHYAFQNVIIHITIESLLFPGVGFLSRRRIVLPPK
eukprot:TRINITY_DN1869_c0_g3_i1.p1 TRINITY_DN1869_c0_g3~~TRINITY_DN1869_c0_g3_i1.p1  ORF type:complete len:184 (-),score=19.18 TRINITY_DN1869_c0_g3_i1:353-904(-)